MGGGPMMDRLDLWSGEGKNYKEWLKSSSKNPMNESTRNRRTLTDRRETEATRSFLMFLVGICLLLLLIFAVRGASSSFSSRSPHLASGMKSGLGADPGGNIGLVKPVRPGHGVGGAVKHQSCEDGAGVPPANNEIASQRQRGPHRITI